ncbi:MAG: hypothetical protein BWY25_02200 [Chloroflexi bacterium ADurb.Bin222]|nr:MAG: hypothetical protein BWY25_02200 [Chloroflexi bacterium ADurb.Bin222]
MTFLQVVTRTFGERGPLLARNQASLAALEDQDWEQTIVRDTVGRGCAWANANLATVPASAEYVWVLDDDDECANPGLLGALKPLRGAAVIVCRATHVRFGVLPHDEHWGAAPVLGDCGWSNLLVRGDVWEAHRGYLAECGVYEGDYRFAAHLWESVEPFAWLDLVAAHYPRVSAGARE